MAKAKVSQPPYFDASLISPCINSAMSFGITGIIIPQPVISINMVINIKPMAACFLFCFIFRKCITKKRKIPNSFRIWDLNIKAPYPRRKKHYNSNAFLGFPFIRISTGFSNASFTATRKPTDSLPSIILWS